MAIELDPLPDAMSVDEMISALQQVSWQGHGAFKVFGEHGDAKPHFFAKGQTFEVNKDKGVVDIYPRGKHAHHHI